MAGMLAATLTIGGASVKGRRALTQVCLHPGAGSTMDTRPPPAVEPGAHRGRPLDEQPTSPGRRSRGPRGRSRPWRVPSAPSARVQIIGALRAVESLRRAVTEGTVIDWARLKLSEHLAMACAWRVTSSQALSDARGARVAVETGYRRYLALSVSNGRASALLGDDRAVTTLSLRGLRRSRSRHRAGVRQPAAPGRRPRPGSGGPRTSCRPRIPIELALHRPHT
jgi:hypothetical protein